MLILIAKENSINGYSSNLNTSHVNLNLYFTTALIITYCYLNTSHVNLNLKYLLCINFHHLFKYISC